MRKTNSYKVQKSKISHKFILVLLILTCLVCAVTIISSSISWFTPTIDENNFKNIALVETDVPLRSETCSFNTYEGIMASDGTISYSSTPVTTGESFLTGTATPANGVDGKVKPAYKYFKTEVLNSSYQYPSCVSLFLSSVNEGVNLGVTYPSNSYRTVLSGETNDFYLIRNAYVKVRLDSDVDGPGLLTIEWFIRNDSTTTNMSIVPSNLYLVYN